MLQQIFMTAFGMPSGPEAFLFLKALIISKSGGNFRLDVHSNLGYIAHLSRLQKFQ